MIPWWRTRSTGKPSALTLRSARSICAQRLGVDGGAVGDPATPGRAWRASPRSGARSARASSRTSALLVSLQRMDDAVLGGGFQARPPVALVVLVGAAEQRVVAAVVRELRRARRRARTCRSSSGPGRWRGSRGGRARRCGRSRARCRCARRPACAPSSSPVATAGLTAVTASALVAERAVGDRGDDARVDAAGERDDRAAERSDRGSSIIARAPPRGRWAQTTLTGSPLMRAARSQSACSGARLTTLPSRLADLDRAPARRRPRP